MHQLKIVNEYLSQFLTPEKRELFQRVLHNRTRYITVVLEDIYQSQNASAVLRTAECFGIHDVHVIENKFAFNVNPDVALGATQWINLTRHNQHNENTVNVVNDLKANGYRIVATTPHRNDVNLDDFDLGKGKNALFFGTERAGLSQTMLDNADEYLKIPMLGFTESFNISVSAALIMHSLTQKMRQSSLNWQLTELEKEAILHRWTMNSLKKPELLLKRICIAQGFDLNLFKNI